MRKDVSVMARLANVIYNKKVSERITKICQENDIIMLGIFGSYARGEQRAKSDVDVLIKFEKGKEKGLIGLVQLKRNFQHVFNRKTDLLTMGGISPYLKKDILNEMKVIYEKR
jgi:uncharacterized protein